MGTCHRVLPVIGALSIALVSVYPTSPVHAAGPDLGVAAKPAPTSSDTAAAKRAPAPQYIVRLKTRKALDHALAAEGASAGRVWRNALNGFVAPLTGDDVARLRNDPDVVSVEQDSVVELSSDDSSPPWGLDRIDQRTPPLSKSYSYASTGIGVTAYIVDTGIRTTHTEFRGRIPRWASMLTDGTGVEDCNGHGTHVAGIIGGTTFGVAKAVSLVPVKVFGCSGGAAISTVISGLGWIVDDHRAGVPAVVNMSLAADVSPSLDAAVTAVIADGVTVVVAAGNDRRDACFDSPARAPAAITVGASDRDDRVASYSNWGTCNDLFAPGTSVLSAWNSSDTAATTLSGTSMAAPHVTGAVARILEGAPEYTPAQVWAAIDADVTTGVLTNTWSSDPNKLLHVPPIAASIPGPPQVLTALGGDSQVALSWSAPTADGGSAITDYVVDVRAAGGSWTTFADIVSTVPGATVTGLVNETGYDFQVAAVNASGAGPMSSPISVTPAPNWAPPAVGFQALPPLRVFDSRRAEAQAAVEVGKSPYGGSNVLAVKVAGAAGVPLTGVGAVSLNVTVVNPIGTGFVTVFPCGDRPLASSLNYTAGETVANAVVSPLSPDGEVCLFSSVDADLLADVNGWFPTGRGFTALTPVRVFDTRESGRSGALRIKFTDVAGVPPTGVSAVSLNVTVVDPAGAGFVTVYPCGDQPLVSSLNYTAAQTVANAVIAPLSAQGDVCFYSSVEADLLADVNGWFATGSSFTAVAPGRVFGTRPSEPAGAIGVAKQHYGDLQVKVTGAAGVPLTGVSAVSLNVTVVGPVGAGFVTVFPCGDRPMSSSLNYTAGQIVANAVIAPLSASGEVCLYSSAGADLVADVNGWFASG